MGHEIPFGRDITLTLTWDDPLPARSHRVDQTAAGTLDVTLRPVGGHLRGTRDVLVERESLVRFQRALAQLLDDLSGSATLEPMMGLGDHGDFALTVTLKYGKGALSGFLMTHYHEARLTFEGIEVDQSYLAETQLQLRALLARG